MKYVVTFADAPCYAVGGKKAHLWLLTKQGRLHRVFREGANKRDALETLKNYVLGRRAKSMVAQLAAIDAAGKEAK